jgi:hypothetical protein
MDLLEDFNTVRTTFADLSTAGERFDNGTTDDGLKDRGGPASPSLSYDGPSLSVDVTVRQAARWDTAEECSTAVWRLSSSLNQPCTHACRGRGQVIAAASATDTVLLVTSKGFLIRYHWDETGTERGETLWAAGSSCSNTAILTTTSGRMSNCICQRSSPEQI